MLRKTAAVIALWAPIITATGSPAHGARVEPARSGVEIYSAPEAGVVRELAINWAAEHGIADDQRLLKIGELWSFTEGEPGPRELFDKVITTFSLAHPKTEEFVGQCSLDAPSLLPPDVELLLTDQTDEFYTQSMRLFHARYLAQRKMFDEALDAFASVDPHRAVDPATALFFKAVCEHQLLKKDDGLKTLTALLKNTERVPPSYSGIAELMQYELQNLEEESLDEVARMMRDVERRLDLGHGGQKVQKKEDEVIARLDKIIEKLEQCQCQGGGGGNSSGNSNNTNRSNGPAGDSQVKGATAPGEVDEKDYRNSGGWGDLPPRAEAKAKQLIDRDFPPHYRAVIEEWNKKLAKRRATTRERE